MRRGYIRLVALLLIFMVSFSSFSSLTVTAKNGFNKAPTSKDGFNLIKRQMEKR